MKHFALAALLFAFAVPAAAQDVTPAIDPGLAGIAAANRESLELDAARSGGRHRAGAVTARQGTRLARLRAERRRELRRARRRAARGW